MRDHAIFVAALAVALVSIGCASRPLDRHFEAGELGEAARLFASDSSLQRDERALFRVGLAHATPGGPAYQPGRARELLRRLLALHPTTTHGAEARRTLALLDELERAERLIAERDAERRELTDHVAGMQARIDGLEASLQREETLTDVFRQMVERLEADLRGRETQLRSLQEELERLKEIDLKRRRPGSPDSTT